MDSPEFSVMDIDHDTQTSRSDTDDKLTPSFDASSFMNEHENDTISTSPIYQTRWTFACKHMFIHDDEDPLYPIRLGPPQLLRTSKELCPMCKEMGKSIPPERTNVVLRDDEKHLNALTTKKDTLSQHMRTLSKTGQGRQVRVVQDAYLQSSVEEARQVWTVEKRNAYDRERDLHVILGLGSQFTAAVLTAKQRFIQRKLQDLSVVFFMASRHADSAEERAIFEGRWKFVSNLRQEIMRLTDGQLKGLSRSSAGGMNEIEMRESIVMDVWDRFVNFMQDDDAGNG